VLFANIIQGKKGEKPQRDFLVHAVEFTKDENAEAMSKVLIAECEEVYVIATESIAKTSYCGQYRPLT
jgi:hypothetical protein